MTPRFLLLETVLALHDEQIQVFGGTEGMRDQGLLESALAQPQATFAGAYLHASLHEMAAADLFHVVRNHPFLDGNKCTGYMAALVFLAVNGVPTDEEFEELYEMTMASRTAAQGRPPSPSFGVRPPGCTS